MSISTETLVDGQVYTVVIGDADPYGDDRMNGETVHAIWRQATDQFVAVFPQGRFRNGWALDEFLASYPDSVAHRRWFGQGMRGWYIDASNAAVVGGATQVCAAPSEIEATADQVYLMDPVENEDFLLSTLGTRTRSDSPVYAIKAARTDSWVIVFGENDWPLVGWRPDADLTEAQCARFSEGWRCRFTAGQTLRVQLLAADPEGLVPELVDQALADNERIVALIKEKTDLEAQLQAARQGEADAMAAVRAEVEHRTAAETQLRQAREQHKADILVIGEHLLNEADERDWCSEYDDVVDRINRRLTVELPLRQREYTVSMDVTVRVNVLVEAGTRDEAEDAASDRDFSVLVYNLRRNEIDVVHSEVVSCSQG